MRIIIAGSRNFYNYDLLNETMKDFISLLDYYGDITILSGTARGADKLGEIWAEKQEGVVLEHWPANWDKFGKSAGYIRNTEMANYADILIAFWDGKSKGTKHMIDIALDKELLVKVVKYESIS